MQQHSILRRYMSLGITVFSLWAVIFVACPMLRDAVPEIQTLAAFVDETGIETGEFYYTDVEIVGHADHNARSSMEYMPHGPGPMEEAKN